MTRSDVNHGVSLGNWVDTHGIVETFGHRIRHFGADASVSVC
ncbi:MAG TPA: hypothetical protein VH643_29005 [Gemmataceae bacterium]